MIYSKKAKDSISQNNLKLTADKIIEKLDQVRDEGKKSRRRWIWELMQNAKDIPNQYGKVSIEIELFEDKLLFKHNGDPFSVDNLTALIQQVSSKPSDGSAEETTGKFGTGFITTHLLSDQIYVSGVVQELGEPAKSINKLLLDRSGETSEELMPAIQQALDYIDGIDDETRFPTINNYTQQAREESNKDNVFEYALSNTTGLEAAKIGVQDLKNTLPLTLAFIPKIKEVKVINHIEDTETTYNCQQPSSSTFNSVKIVITDQRGLVTERCFYTYVIDKLELAIEVNNFEENVIKKPHQEQPFLFKDFPLVGTESFWLPFVVNGRSFMPTERRDSIFLIGENKKAKQNRAIFESLSQHSTIFIKHLLDIGCTNRQVLLQSNLPKAYLKEDSSINWYLEKVQGEYRKTIAAEKLIATTNGYCSIDELRLPYMIDANDQTNSDFYAICQRIIKPQYLPQEDIFLAVKKQIGEYEEIKSWGNKVLYKLEDLLQTIEQAGCLEKLPLNDATESKVDWLNELFRFMVQQKNIDLLSEFEVVPNQNGVFKKLNELKSEDSSERIPDAFIDVLKQLGKDWREDLLDRSIEFEMGSHDKLELLHINEAIDEILNKEENRNKVFLDRPDALEHVVRILQINSPDSSQEAFRHKLFFTAKKIFGFKQELLSVPNATKYKYPAANRIMIALINRKIDETENIKNLSELLKQEKTETIKWLNDYLVLIDSASDYKYFIQQKKIIPNRKGELCLYEELYNYGTEDQQLNKKLVDISNQFDETVDYWGKLVAEGIEFRVLNTIKLDEIGTAVTEHINAIKGRDSYEEHREALLNLIDWCSQEKILAERYLPGFKEMANRIFFILTIENSTFSGKIIELLKDKVNLELLDIINESAIEKKDLQNFLNLFAEEKTIPRKVMEYAEEYARQKKAFNNMLEVGQKVEKLFVETLREYEVSSTHSEIIHAGGGAYDIRVFNPITKKSFCIELKSCHYQNEQPISFAVSQVKRAISDLKDQSFGIVIVERSADNEMDTAYIKSNARYFKNPGHHFDDIATNFDTIKNSANRDKDIDLRMDNAEFKGTINYKWLLDETKTTGYDALIKDIHTVISNKTTTSHVI